MSNGSYRDSSRDAGSSNSFVLLKTGCPLQVRFPAWPTTTLFRPFSPMSDEFPDQVSPWRFSHESCDFGPWVYPISKFIRGCGTEKLVTFIADVPGQGSSFYEGPYDRLYRIVKQYAKTRPDWKVLLQGADGEGAKVSRPANAVAMQGALLEHKGKSLKSQPELNCCLILAKSGRTALEEGLDAIKEEYANTPPTQRSQMDLSDLFKCGDIIDPNGGKAIRINCNDGTSQGGDGPTNWSASRNQRGSRPQANNQRVTFPHYEVAFEAFEAPGIEIMQESWVAWDKVFRYLTEAEQVDLLCTAFNKDIIMAAFLDSSFEEYIPAKMRQGFRASPGNNTEAPRPAPVQRQAPQNQPQTQTPNQTQTAARSGAWANAKPAKDETVAEGMPTPDSPEHAMPDPGQGFRATTPAQPPVRAGGFSSQMAALKAIKEKTEADRKAKEAAAAVDQPTN